MQWHPLHVCTCTCTCFYKFFLPYLVPTESVPPASGILKQKTSVLSLMDKIPDEAESLTVLVGGVKFLEEPVVAFVRLAQSHLLGDLTEVPIPVRFIFLQLGPSHGETDYHEVGRAMATLMSDAVSSKLTI